MEIDINNLPKSPDVLREMIASLHQELHKNQLELSSYKEKYVRLLEEFRLEKQRRYSSSSEKNILQSDLFDEAGVELPDEVKEQLEDTIEIKNATRPKHPVRRLLPKDLPREVIVHDIPDLDKVCHCGAPLI